MTDPKAMARLGVDVGKEGGDATGLTVTVTLPLVDRAAGTLLEKAKSMTVMSDEDYMTAVDFASDVKREYDTMEVQRQEMKAPSLEMGKRVDAHYKGPLSVLRTAYDTCKAKLLDYDNRKKAAAEAERKRLEEEKRIERETAQKAERDRLAAIAEEERKRREAAEAQSRQENAARLQAEANEREERARREAAEAQASGDRKRAEDAQRAQRLAEEETKDANALAQAERQKAIDARRAQLRAERETAQATAAADTAATTAAAPVAEVKTELVQGAGVARKLKWKCRVTDLAQVDRRWLMFDQAAADAFAQKNGEQAQSFMGNGIEVYAENELAVRGRRG